MRKESSEFHVESFNEEAKKYQEVDQMTIGATKDTLDQVADLEREIDQKTQKFVELHAELQLSDEESERMILDLQRYKRLAIEYLKRDEVPPSYEEWFNPEKLENQDKESIKVSYSDGHLLSAQDNSELTLGDLLTDGEWGVCYELDPETVPKNIKRKFVLAETRRKIWEAYDEQIMIAKTSSLRTGRNVRKIFEKKEFLSSEAEREYLGIFAEKIVRTLLTKLQIDFKIPIKVERASKESDVLGFIDFRLVYKDVNQIKKRGVHSELADLEVNPHKAADQTAQTKEVAPKLFHEIGIQFTINDDPDVILEKESQIEEAKKHTSYVDDIIIVKMPGYVIANARNQWYRNEFRSGGPEQYLSILDQSLIFHRLLKDIVPEEVIQDSWKQIFNALRSKDQNQNANTNITELNAAA